MSAIRKQVVIERDGELLLSDLPFRKGDVVEAIVQDSAVADVNLWAQARERFLARARNSTFCSTGSYPRRDELYDRP